MTEVLGDLVQRASLVQEQRRAGVAEVVAAEVGEPGALERRDPDASTPVLTAEVATAAVGEDKRVGVGPAVGEVKLGEFARDGPEEFGLASARGLRRRYLVAGDGPLDTEALPLFAAVVEDVSPLERVGLAGSEAFVGEHADERGVLPVELRTDRFDGLGCAGIDRLGTAVGEATRADDGVPVETTPFASSGTNLYANSIGHCLSISHPRNRLTPGDSWRPRRDLLVRGDRLLEW